MLKNGKIGPDFLKMEKSDPDFCKIEKSGSRYWKSAPDFWKWRNLIQENFWSDATCLVGVGVGIEIGVGVGINLY